MRRWIPFLFLCGLAFLALRPLWWQPAAYFFLDDGYLHLFRVFEFDRVLREGVVYPRWAPDLAYGYGYPIFNYYPPFAYYLTETLHLLGLSIPAAVKGAFVVIVCVGLGGSFLLGVELFRDNKHAAAIGLLTACAYVFFPYFLLDIYTRGAIAESLAAAILPWLVWSLKRALAQQTLSSALWTALVSAGFVLSHNLTALFSAPFLVVYILWEWLHLPAALRIKGVRVLACAALLGAALAAIYWLPLLAEMSLVNVSREARQLAIIVQYSIFSPQDVVQFSLPYQYHEAPFPLPLMPILLAALAALFALVLGHRLKVRGMVLFFGLITILAALLLTDWTKGVWLSLPVMMTLQFPWRLSVLIGLGVAVMIGALPVALTSLRDKFGRLPAGPLLIAGLAAILIWVGLANLAPQRLNSPRDEITLAQLVRFEVNSRNVGLGTMDEYLPLTVKFLPRQLESKIDAPVAPPMALEQYSSARRAISVSSPERFSLSLHSFFFPDWQVTIDDQPAVAGPSTAMGLLTVDVPPGEHRVVFQLGDTLPRRIGTLLSILGLVILILLIVRVAFREKRKAIAIIVACAALIAVFAVPTALAWLSAPAPLQPTHAAVSPELNLIGVRVEDARLESNVWRLARGRSTVNLQVYWQVKRQLRDAPFTWQLVDDAGRVWGKREQLARHAAGLAGTWVPNEIVADHYDLPLKPGTPPGRYTLQVAAGDKFISVATMDFINATPSTPDPKIEHPVQARVGDRIRFLGYDAPAVAKPGETLLLTLYWQAQRDIPEDLTVFVQLLDPDRNLVAQNDGLTDNGFLPTTLWSADRIVPDQRNLDLPRDLQPGIYHLVAGLYRFDDLARLPVFTPAGQSPDDQIEVGTIKIPMETSATAEHVLGASLGTSIRLIGFDLASVDARGGIARKADSSVPSRLAMTAGQTIALTLQWQALARMDSDYKVFVHVVDEQGNLVAQQDQIPAHDRYPTRIWDEGERVADSYHLPELPPGRYEVIVGMYSADTGERLIALDEKGQALADRQIIIAQIEIAGQ